MTGGRKQLHETQSRTCSSSGGSRVWLVFKSIFFDFGVLAVFDLPRMNILDQCFPNSVPEFLRALWQTHGVATACPCWPLHPGFPGYCHLRLFNLRWWQPEAAVWEPLGSTTAARCIISGPCAPQGAEVGFVGRLCV